MDEEKLKTVLRQAKAFTRLALDANIRNGKVAIILVDIDGYQSRDIALTRYVSEKEALAFLHGMISAVERRKQAGLG